ncbi:MAG: metal ABC transporter substrate-binding protein [Ilumatobacteraceae bacterium]
MWTTPANSIKRSAVRRSAMIAALVVLCLVAVACASQSGATGVSAPAGSATDGGAAQGRVLDVVTTTAVVTDLVANIGGRNVKIYAVLKPNVDPHDYEPTPADMQAIAAADVIVKNGVGLEKWFDETIRSASPRGIVVDSSTGVVIRRGHASNGDNEGDPHIWHDPSNVKIMVANIATALETADPAAADTFRANLASYSAQLDTLDQDNRQQIDTLTNNKLVTNHDAFGYYVQRYGLDYVGSVIPSFDTQSELSPADVNALVAKIKAEGVKAVFSEAALPPKTAEAIGREAGVKVVAGNGSLYGDSLGLPGSDADTYLKMEAHNTRTIVDNLR